MAALIPIFMQYLPILFKAAQAVPEIIGFVQRTQEVLKQSKEWTADQQAAFDERMEQVTSQEHWKPEK